TKLYVPDLLSPALAMVGIATSKAAISVVFFMGVFPFHGAPALPSEMTGAAQAQTAPTRSADRPTTGEKGRNSGYRRSGGRQVQRSRITAVTGVPSFLSRG